MSRSKTSNLTPFDYDLNIFQMEQLNAEGEYEHFGPWYIHVYICGEGTNQEMGDPIQLTEDEYINLISNDSYFDDEVDTWYGLKGFMLDKWDLMSDRLKTIFEGLPKYQEEVLFNA